MSHPIRRPMSARPARPVLLALAVFGLAACTAQERSDRADLARSALVGLSASDLAACAGDPDRLSGSAGAERWVYGTGTIDRPYSGSVSSRLDDDAVFTRGTRSGVTAGISVPGRIQSSYCETVFTLADGRVVAVDYRSPTGIRIGDFGTRYAECERTVSGCLARVERRIESRDDTAPPPLPE